MSAPKVSIIIPNYNHAKFLKQRLDSILNQTYQDFEVILLDDASTDSSVEVLMEYASHPKVSHFVVNDQNSGSPFKQWKMGLQIAKGDYVWIAESDDFSDKDFLNDLVHVLDSEAALGFCYCRSFRVDIDGISSGIVTWGEELSPESWDKSKVFDSKEFLTRYLRFRNIIPNVSAVLFRRDKMSLDQEVLEMKWCGDWMLYCKIALNNPVKYVSKSLNFFRRYDSASTFKDGSITKERMRINEYKRVIKFVNGSLQIKLRDGLENYFWICDNWINNESLKKEDFLQYMFPNLFPSLFPYFYRTMLKKLRHAW